MLDMRRRKFLALLGGAAAWPLAARAETAATPKRVGVLSPFALETVESRRLMEVFVQSLHDLGWADGRNVRVEQRWSTGDNERMQSDARELAGMPADAVLAIGTPAVAMLKREAPRIPIVFVAVSDPVGSGLVDSLPRPGGNITGFINLEGSLAGKWLQLLKGAVPTLTHAGFMFNPESAPYVEYYRRAFEAAAPALAVTPIAMPIHTIGDIERVMRELKARPVGGLVVMPDTFTTVNRQQIVALSLRERVPVVHTNGATARQGGLIGYGIDNVESVRGAAGYVDRILRGTKPADLPVQMPTKFELVINLKTAKALGLDLPPTLLARADEVIE
jgi:putative tryptophan/tyrosine transport system substrate-binding protein